MKFAVIQFPGSNCDADCFHAVTAVCGQTAEYVWYQNDALPDDVDAVIIPGGFSYGDYLRAGALASNSPIMHAVKSFANAGGTVIGICNGFQILTEAGLLPGALLRNAGLKFLCQPVQLETVNSNTRFTQHAARFTTLPIAHHDGNYVVDAETLAAMDANGQIIFRYIDNPNGSVGDIAGVCNEAGNVLGMMPHPERVVEAALGGTDGLGVFESMISAITESRGREVA